MLSHTKKVVAILLQLYRTLGLYFITLTEHGHNPLNETKLWVSRLDENAIDYTQSRDHLSYGVSTVALLLRL